jgi:dipeptidyl-peptidase-4
MKILRILSLFCFLATTFLTAQNKEFTLDEIWSGTFRTEGLEALHSMNNGQQYSVLNFDRASGATTIDIYDYKTLEKVKTLVSSKDLDLKYFSDYTFSKDENKILLAFEEESVFRRSSLGKYVVYDVSDQSVHSVANYKIQEPTFSPDGKKVAYGYQNNLYVKNLESNDVTQLTFDGEKNKVINGITDWVYEEEFGFVRAFDWNADSNKIAFIRFDESDVPEFSMDVYGKDLYQTQTVFKYPKAGERNAVVSLHLFDLDKNKLEEVKVNKTYNDFYIPRIKWSHDANMLSAIYMNRHQNQLDLWMIDASQNEAYLVIEEKDKAYIDITDNLTFLKDKTFIWTSEKDGYNHVYHYSKKGKLINQITKGNWEVTEYYGYDSASDRIFYQSVENGSINRDVYSIKLNGTQKRRLTQNEGTNNADFSANFTYFINTFSSATTPYLYTLNDANTGKVLKTIKDNKDLKETLKAYTISNKEFSTISVNGNDLNMWMIKPANFDASKQYPLFMFQYSGPGSQQVANKWHSANDYWYQMLAQQGYIIACVDGRGTGLKGADFKKVTQNELGKFEVEDQIEAAKLLGARPYIDSSRMGIWGWSYGGFMSSNALFKGNDVFKMAIAVAPVTSCRFYDSIYTALVQANKQFEWMIYPDKNHGIYGGNTRLHLYTKMTNFINRTLGDKL